MWEEMSNELYVDGFCDFLEDPNTLYYLTCTVFNVVNSSLLQTKEIILNSIMNTLCLPENVKVSFETSYLTPIFREFSSNIFNFSEECYKSIIEIIKEHTFNLKNYNIDDWVKSVDMEKYLKSLYEICVHMMLNDPPIKINIDSSKVNYKIFSKITDHCVDGFPKDDAVCIVLMPSPKGENGVYHGIKNSVIMINNPSNEIVESIQSDNKKIETDNKLSISILGRLEEINSNLLTTEDNKPTGTQFNDKLMRTSSDNEIIIERIRNDYAIKEINNRPIFSFTCIGPNNYNELIINENEFIPFEKELINRNGKSKTKGTKLQNKLELAKAIKLKRKVCNVSYKKNEETGKECIDESIRNHKKQFNNKTKTIKINHVKIAKHLGKCIIDNKLDTAYNRNIPFQPLRLMTQQEKSNSNTESQKISNSNSCKFSKKEHQAESEIVTAKNSINSPFTKKLKKLRIKLNECKNHIKERKRSILSEHNDEILTQRVNFRESMV